MSVIPITVFFSLLLVGLFVVLFVREQRRQRFASSERESLLPLADETPRVSGASGDPETVIPASAAPRKPAGFSRLNVTAR